MRFYGLACALVVMYSSVVYSQGLQSVAAEGEHEPQTFTLKVTEVQFKPEAKAAIDAKELPQKWDELERSGKFSLVETVTMSVLEGYEMKARFGKKINYVAGRPWPLPRNAQGNEPRGIGSINFIEAGTVVKVKAEVNGAKIGLMFAYEATRLADNPASAIGYDTINTSIESTFMLEPGKPILASGSNAETGTYVILSIE